MDWRKVLQENNQEGLFIYNHNFYNIYFYFISVGVLSACVYIPLVCLVYAEFQRGHQVS